MLSAAIGYFAFISQRIPPRQVFWFVLLFFLGSASQIVGDLVPHLPSSLYFIYNIFPATQGGVQSVLNDPAAGACSGAADDGGKSGGDYPALGEQLRPPRGAVSAPDPYLRKFASGR